MSRRRSGRWSDKHLGRALELLEDAHDLAREEDDYLHAAQIHTSTVLPRAIYEKRLRTFQQNTGAKFVEECIEDLEEVLEDDVGTDVAHRVRNALQHLYALRYCPVCGREVVTELVVDVIGSGSRNVPRGTICVTPEVDPNGWRIFCHEGGESR
jgi:hypothetical protein